MVVAVDDDGCFTDRITDFKGRYVKEADKDIILAVKVIMADYINWPYLKGSLFVVATGKLL